MKSLDHGGWENSSPQRCLRPYLPTCGFTIRRSGRAFAVIVKAPDGGAPWMIQVGPV